MRDARGFYHSRSFQFHLLGANMLEQSSAFTEEYGHEVKLYFIKNLCVTISLAAEHPVMEPLTANAQG